MAIGATIRDGPGKIDAESKCCRIALAPTIIGG